MNIIAFNVIIFDNRQLRTYNIIPYFVNKFKETNKTQRPNIKSHSELKKFIIDKSKYQFWSRCEYEILISSWPNDSNKEKISVHTQIMWNIDVITKILSKYLISLGF